MDSNDNTLIWFKKLQTKRSKLAQQLKDPAAAGLWKSVIDKYADNAHFVYELLQNSDDALASSVNVHFINSNSAIEYRHNGKVGFSLSDPDLENDLPKYLWGHINAISSIGASNKSNQLSNYASDNLPKTLPNDTLQNIGKNIGKFGVGFKSVFKYSHQPHIEDDLFCFDLVDFIVPTLTQRRKLFRHPHETSFLLPISPTDLPTIRNKFLHLDNPLLFLPHLKEINLYNNSQLLASYSKETLDEDDGRLFVRLSSPSEHQFFLIFSQPIFHNSFFNSRKSRGENTPSICIAFPSDENGNPCNTFNTYNTFTNCDSPIFCFFKTTQTTPFPFIIHAPFLLTESRENLILEEENATQSLSHPLPQSLSHLNHLLLHQSGELAIHAIESLLVHPFPKNAPVNSTASLLRLISHSFVPHTSNKTNLKNASASTTIAKEISKGIESSLMSAHLFKSTFKSTGGKWASHADILLPDDARFSQFVNFNTPYGFTDLLELDENERNSILSFLEFHHAPIERLTFTDFLHAIEHLLSANNNKSDNTGNTERANDLLENPLDGDLKLGGDTSDWFVRLYTFLYQLKREGKLQSSAIRDASIFICEDDVCRPASEVYLSTKTEGNFITIRPDIKADPTCLKFLTSIGINPPDLLDEITRVVLPTYTNNGVNGAEAILPTAPPHIAQHLLLLTDYYHSLPAFGTERPNFVQLLQNVPMLPTRNATGELRLTSFSNSYLESDMLRDFFIDADSVCFFEKEWIAHAIPPEKRKNFYDFLLAAGVHFGLYIKSVKKESSESLLEKLDLHPISLRQSDNGAQIIIDKEIDALNSMKWDVNKSAAFYSLLQNEVQQRTPFMFRTQIEGIYTYTEKNKRHSTQETIYLTTAKQTIFRTPWLLTQSGKWASPNDIDDTTQMADFYDKKANDLLLFLGIQQKGGEQRLSPQQEEALRFFDQCLSQGISLNVIKEAVKKSQEKR